MRGIKLFRGNERHKCRTRTGTFGKEDERGGRRKLLSPWWSQLRLRSLNAMSALSLSLSPCSCPRSFSLSFSPSILSLTQLPSTLDRTPSCSPFAPPFRSYPALPASRLSPPPDCRRWRVALFSPFSSRCPTRPSRRPRPNATPRCVVDTIMRGSPLHPLCPPVHRAPATESPAGLVAPRFAALPALLFLPASLTFYL